MDKPPLFEHQEKIMEALKVNNDTVEVAKASLSLSLNSTKVGTLYDRLEHAETVRLFKPVGASHRVAQRKSGLAALTALMLASNTNALAQSVPLSWQPPSKGVGAPAAQVAKRRAKSKQASKSRQQQRRRAK